MKILLSSIILFLLLISNAYSQRVGFIASDVIREKFPEAKQAEQRIRSIVEEWKRDIEDMEKRIENLKFEINKNRLIWTEEEKKAKGKRTRRLDNAKACLFTKKI